MYDPTRLPAWKALEEHQREVALLHLRDLFRDDPGRFARFSKFPPTRAKRCASPLPIDRSPARCFRNRPSRSPQA